MRQQAAILIDGAGTAADGLRQILADLGHRVDADVPGRPELVVVAPLDQRRGLEAVRRLRGAVPDVPVVFVTARGSEEAAVAALRAGVTDYLRWPTTPADLEASLDRCLKERRPLIPLYDSTVEPEDFTGPYVLLASRTEGRNITGAVLPVDGGIAVRGFGTPAGGADL